MCLKQTQPEVELAELGPSLGRGGCGPTEPAVALPWVLRRSHADPTPHTHLALAPQAHLSLGNCKLNEQSQGRHGGGGGGDPGVTVLWESAMFPCFFTFMFGLNSGHQKQQG